MTETIFSATRADFRIDWFSGTGGGGQHRNKHQNCCRIVHLPTGLTAIGQEERSRVANQRRAFRRLAATLVERALAAERRARWPSPDEVVRTYHEPDNRVVDRASGLQREYAATVRGRAFGDLIEARLGAVLKKVLDKP